MQARPVRTAANGGRLTQADVAARQQARAVARRRARSAALRRRRQLTVLALLAVTVLLVGLDFARGSGQDDQPDSLAGVPVTVPSIGGGPGGGDPGGDEPGTGPSAEMEDVPSEQASSDSEPSPSVSVIQQGAGTFKAAPGTGPRAGAEGAPSTLRYLVEVEDGIGQDAEAFADAAGKVLADQRSWIRGGQVAFQRVSAEPYDFRIVLASPNTVDKLCYPLRTLGQVSCRQGDRVVINLTRWLFGVPQFNGDLTRYRQYVINHEVGHKLGYNHVRCATPGTPAPVMQQQTYDLRQCSPNGWPYPNGKLLTGPAVSGS